MTTHDLVIFEPTEAQVKEAAASFFRDEDNRREFCDGCNACIHLSATWIDPECSDCPAGFDPLNLGCVRREEVSDYEPIIDRAVADNQPGDEDETKEVA